MSIQGLMHAAGISGSSFAMIAAGVRAQVNARLSGRLLEDAGLMDARLAQGFGAVDDMAGELIQAGTTGATLDLVGTLIDALG